MCVCVCVRSVTFALRDFRIRRRVFLLFFIPSFACSLAPPLAFSPLFSILFWKRRKKGKKNRARNAERSFFSFFHPTLSISVSRLKSLIEVLQPASRPATRRKKKVYRSKPVVGLLLYHSISSSSTSSLLYKLLFFFAFVVHWASCSAKSFLFISKAGSLLLLIFLC